MGECRECQEHSETAAGWLCRAALGGTCPSAPLGTSGKHEQPHLLLGVQTAVVYSSWYISVKTAGFSCKIQQPGLVPGVWEHAARASAWEVFANRQIPSGFYCLPLDYVKWSLQSALQCCYITGRFLVQELHICVLGGKNR